MHDADIVKNIIKGDCGAFELLIKKYQLLVLNTCFKILRDQEDAKDITQEVFFEAFRSIIKLRQTNDISYWLYRVATNKSLNFCCKNKNSKHSLCIDNCTDTVLESTKDGQNPVQDPQQEIEKKEAREILLNAIGQLPQRQQKVFMLHKIEGYSNKEISELLELSLSSIESLMHRAKGNLRKILSSYYESNFN